MVFRFCPQCGKEPLAHNAMREGEYSCPDCHGEFFIDLLSAFLGGDPPHQTAVGDFVLEASPQEALAAATAEIDEDFDPEAPRERDNVLLPGDGGPAFPRPSVYGTEQESLFEYGDAGLSVRDWFAGQALASTAIRKGCISAGLSLEASAALCFILADAMIDERKKRKEAGHV